LRLKRAVMYGPQTDVQSKVKLAEGLCDEIRR
jgi:hypothetical protein